MPKPEISDDQIKTLWKHGTLLSNAWVKFAHPDTLKRWQEVSAQSASESFVKAAETAPIERANFFESLAATIGPAAEIARAQSEVRKTMQAALVGYIKKGLVFAYGFEPPRTLASVPVSLPVSVWSGEIDWTQSRLSYSGLNFEQVRLVPFRVRDGLLQRPAPIKQTPAQKVGRPGVGPEIEAACRALIEAGKVDVTKSAKSHFAAIRQALRQHEEGLSVPPQHISDKTLSRYFTPFFNALKEGTKL